MFTHGQIVFEVLLVNPPKGAQEIPYCGPQALNRVGVDLPDAIAIIISGPFFGTMTDGTVPTLDPPIARPLIGVATRLPLRIAMDMRLQRDAIRMLADPQATASSLAPNRSHHRGSIVLIGAVSFAFVGVPPGWVGRVGVALSFFPPHSGTSHRSPCPHPARTLRPTSHNRWPAPSAVRDAPCSDIPPIPRLRWRYSPLCKRHGAATPFGGLITHSQQTLSHCRGYRPGRSVYSGNQRGPVWSAETRAHARSPA